MTDKSTLPEGLLSQLTPGTDVEKLQQVADYVEKRSPVNISQIAKALSLTNTTARGYLEKMVKAGMVREQVQGMARTFTWNRTMMDVGVVFMRALAPSAQIKAWKGMGVDIVKYTILYPDKSGQEINFWIAYSAKKKPMTIFVNKVKALMAKLETPRLIKVDIEDDEDQLLNSPLLDIAVCCGGHVSLQECSMEEMENNLGNAYFAVITGNGYRFDFETGDSQYTLPSLYNLLSISLGSKDPFMARNYKNTMEQVIPSLRAAGLDIKEVEIPS